MAVAIAQAANPAGVAASSTIATYTGVSTGTAASDRIVAVVVATELSASTATECTIDGVTMTAGTAEVSGIQCSRVFYKFWPTGTTAEIKVTFGAVSPNAAQNHIAVYKVTGASDTLSAQGSDVSLDMDASDPLSVSVTIPTDGGFLAVASCQNDTNAKTWANATGDIDEDGGQFRITTATSTTAGTLSFNVTSNGNVTNTNNSYGAISDAKLKENIVDASPKLADLMQVRVRNYNFKEGQTPIYALNTSVAAKYAPTPPLVFPVVPTNRLPELSIRARSVVPPEPKAKTPVAASMVSVAFPLPTIPLYEPK